MELSIDDVLKLDQASLRDLRAEDIQRRLTAEEVAHIYGLCNCFWQWSGHDYDPHALLASGKHSDGFINSRLALAHGNIARLVANQMARIYGELGLPKPEYVVSASYGGNDVGAHLAEMMGAIHLFTEKGEDGQVWKSLIPINSFVLPIEELVTKGTTSSQMIKAVRNHNMYPVKLTPILLTMILRSELKRVENLMIQPVVSYNMKDYDPAECPMCAAGSKPLPPKGDNWHFFQAQMAK